MELIDFYKFMVEVGYRNDYFNLGKYNIILKKIFDEYKIKMVLDYGAGRGSWEPKIYNDNTISA